MKHYSKFEVKILLKQQRQLCAEAQAQSKNDCGSGYPGLHYTKDMYKEILEAPEPDL